MKILIITDGDKKLCQNCYDNHVDEMDMATWIYTTITSGQCDDCDIILERNFEITINEEGVLKCHQ